MKSNLSGKRVAILATDGFERSELEAPRRALREAGAEAVVVSLKSGRIRCWDGEALGKAVDVDLTVAEADPGTFDGLVLPGGVINPDTLRMNPEAVAFVRTFFASGKPVGAICHGPWMLVEADVVEGRKVTSYPSIRRDLINAGANWVDEPVVTDRGLVTSRKPDDLPDFNRKLVEEIAEGIHPQGVDERLREGGDFGAGARPMPT